MRLGPLGASGFNLGSVCLLRLNRYPCETCHILKSRYMRPFLNFIISLACAGFLQAATHRVEVGSNYFRPSSLAIAVGDTVLWEAVSGTHNVSGPFFRSEVLPAPWTFSHTFTNDTRASYVCEPHQSHMRGVITVGNPRPSLILEGPEPGATVSHTELVRFTARSGDAWWNPFTVEFFDGTNSLFIARVPPFELNREFAPGPHTITAVGTDGSLMATSAPISFTAIATNLRPSVAFTAPTNNVALLTTDLVTFTVNASDPETHVARVDYFLDGQFLASSTNPPFTLPDRTLPLGLHIVEAVAYDSTGLSSAAGAARIRVEVYLRPHLRITPPANGFGEVFVPSAWGLVTLEESTDPLFTNPVDKNSASPGGGGVTFNGLPFNKRAAFYRVRIDRN